MGQEFGDGRSGLTRAMTDLWRILKPRDRGEISPTEVDRIVVHQFDPACASPGGIDTCLRGIARYAPDGSHLAFVGVDAGEHVEGRKVGRWEQYDWGSGVFWFMPVAKLDPGNQKRYIPHSLRVVVGVIRYRHRLPTAAWFQAHRLDTAWVLHRILAKRTAYFIHTQGTGLTGTVSDSFWKFAGGIHKLVERSAVRRAEQVVVFNEEYSKVVQRWNPKTRGSPTWYDPRVIVPEGEVIRDAYSLIWVGRLEVLKDPLLALASFEALAEIAPDEPWQLHFVGSGTMLDELKKRVEILPSEWRTRVIIHGRLAPERVADLMARSTVFIMTSHPGYEGYPRVLVEALASALPAVVTDGSDTGGLVRSGMNGFVTTRDPSEIAEKIRRAANLGGASPKSSVASLSAPAVIAEIYRAVDVC